MNQFNPQKQILNKCCLLLCLGIIGAFHAITVDMWAGNPLGLCGPHQPYSWDLNNGPVPFNIDQHDPGSNFGSLVQDAFKVWEDVPESNITFQDLGAIPVNVSVDNFYALANADFLGLNPIIQDENYAIIDDLYGPGSGILGFAGFMEIQPAPDCRIVRGFALMGDSPNLPRNILFKVLIHEFGHYIGIGHTAVNGELFYKQNYDWAANPGIHLPQGTIQEVHQSDISIMFPFLDAPDNHELSRDDRSSLAALYPAPNTYPTVTATGTVFDANNNPLSGVNVIARNIADPLGDAISGFAGIHEPGKYQIPGLRYGQTYVFHTSENVSGGGYITQPGIFEGPEEFYNGFNESNNLVKTDNVTDATELKLFTGFDTLENVDFIFNIQNTPPDVQEVIIGDYNNPNQIGGQTIRITALVKNASQVALLVNMRTITRTMLRIPMTSLGNALFEAVFTLPENFNGDQGEIEINVAARSKGRLSSIVSRKILLFDSDTPTTKELLANSGFESGTPHPWGAFQPFNGLLTFNNVNPISGLVDLKSTPIDPSNWNNCEFFQLVKLPKIIHKTKIAWKERWVAQKTHTHFVSLYLYEPLANQLIEITNEAFDIYPGITNESFELDITEIIVQNNLAGKEVYFSIYKESVDGDTTTQFDDFSMQVETSR